MANERDHTTEKAPAPDPLARPRWERRGVTNAGKKAQIRAARARIYARWKREHQQRSGGPQ